MNEEKYIDFSKLSYGALYRYKKLLLPNTSRDNIPREELIKLVEDHFHNDLHVAKETIKTEFFALPKEANYDDINKRKAYRP